MHSGSPGNGLPGLMRQTSHKEDGPMEWFIAGLLIVWAMGVYSIQNQVPKE